MGRYLFQRMYELKQVLSTPQNVPGNFFCSKKGVGSSVLPRVQLLGIVCAQTSRKCNPRQMCAGVFTTSQMQSHPSPAKKIAESNGQCVTGTCISWHLENKIQSKCKQIMKQDVMHSTDNKIRSFEKWETGLFLLLDKTENLTPQLMVELRRMTAISVTQLCARTY